MPFGGLLTAGIGAAGSLFGGLFGGNASAQASKQYQQALQKSQNFLQGQEQQGLENFAPYQQAGAGAATSLSKLLGTPGQGLLQNWDQKFTAPTAEEAAATPGYQFQLKQGQDAIQNSAAGQGSLLSGRTLADLNNYTQGAAATNYQNVFNNDLTQYQSAYNTFLNNQNNQYSRLLGVSGQGLQAAQGAGGLISGIGGDIASLMGQQGAAQAQGTIGQANAYGGILPGISSSINNGLLLSSLNGNSASQPTFNGGSVDGRSDPALGTPSYMPTGQNPYAGTSPTPPAFMLSSLMQPQQPQY